MSSQSQPQTTTQISKVELPEWVSAASQKNYQQAERVADIPYQGYSGQRVAKIDPWENMGMSTATGGFKDANSSFDVAQGVAAREAGFNPTMIRGPGSVADVTAQSFLSRDINKYMDPNLQSVVDPTMDRMRREIDLGQQGIADNARGAGAWGSSRHGVAEAVFGAEGVRNMAGTEAGLRSAAFTDAAGRIGQDNATALQAAMANQNKNMNWEQLSQSAQTANQGAEIAGANVRLGAGQLATGTGSAISGAANQTALLQQGFGQSRRAIKQANLDNSFQNWQDRINAPKEAVNLRLAALGMSPYGKTTTNETTQPGPSSNPWMTGIGAAASILPMLFSDKKVKKNVKKVGKVPGTDLNAYEFEYKKGFMGRDTPKQIGLMAQDVEKKVPGAVKSVKANGKTVKAVDYEKAIAGAPRDKRDDKGQIRGTYKPRRGFMGRKAA